jgi:hypothetical protein
MWSVAKSVRHPFLVWKIEGSSPSTPKDKRIQLDRAMDFGSIGSRFES